MGPPTYGGARPNSTQKLHSLDTVLALYGFHLILAFASGNEFGTKAMELENSCFYQCAAVVRIKIGGGEHFLFLVLPGLWIPQEWGPNILIEGTPECSECLH